MLSYALCDCGHKCVVTCPAGTDAHSIECDKCGARTLRFVSSESFRRVGGPSSRLILHADGRVVRPPQLSKEERAKRAPRPPAELVDALHDSLPDASGVFRHSGRLISSAPIVTTKKGHGP